MLNITLNTQLHKIALIVLIWHSDYVQPLKLSTLQVPNYVHLGSQATLLCLWHMDKDDVLYSVKWYKDGQEFFRYVPGDMESYKKFAVPGVEVRTFEYLGSTITLSPAVIETEGRFRCEVSGERPRFFTVSDHADMKVIVLPKMGPNLCAVRSVYDIGDVVTINCTSEPSRPVIQLAWYINGVPAQADSVASYSYINSNGLQISSIGLNLTLRNKYMTANPIKIKCLGTIPFMYWQSKETCINIASKDTDEHTATESATYESLSRASNIRTPSIIAFMTYYYIVFTAYNLHQYNPNFRIKILI